MSPIDDEAGRLAAFQRYDVLDVEAASGLDLISELMRAIYAVPMAAVSLIDAERLFMKSHPGLPHAELPRRDTFCDRTIRERQVLEVIDAQADQRFRDSPCVASGQVRSYLGAPLTTPDGYNIGTICVIDTVPRNHSALGREVLANLARLVMVQMELLVMGTTDQHTSASTRRAFLAMLRRAIDRVRQNGPGSALVVLDLDEFRTVNETYGDEYGDVVLATVSDALRRAIRRGDQLGRLGGDKFGICLQETSLEDARQVAERLRHAVEDARFPGHPDLQVTASFGVVPCLPDHASAEAWVLAAEELVARAKLSGRNRALAPQTGGTRTALCA